ncbi:MAG: alanine--tRNA ligase [Firmicutes bacterium]|nr:alanine--tRNA ligase [Bacillota bacterium]
MTGNEVRERFLKFFAAKDHLILPSASLIPENDQSLLLIGAGMAPFKPYFTGQKTPPRPRIVTCQKCVRTGDLENVGRTARHHTFFEMLGNFSFADYFKEEAIAWAWEFMVGELRLPVEKLWVSIYREDDEAYTIWRKKIGVPAGRIVRLGKADNFWEIGPGPCGPCSEIYYDLGPEWGCASPHCAPGCDCDRYLEIWNLVFTQFDRDEDGNYTPLPKKNIDTGMGLERITAVMQGVASNYDTDLILPIITGVAQLAGVNQDEGKNRLSLNVIADHLRAVVHMVADGILPTNEGRGYVLRRLLRRALRHGRLLGIKDSFLHLTADTVIAIGEGTYPELGKQRDLIREVIKLEEDRFRETLQGGMNILSTYLREMKDKNQKVLSGERAFRLYDTYGFPLELTKEIVAEKGFQIAEEDFARAMEDQRERARSARQKADGMLVGEDTQREIREIAPTSFVGYEGLIADSRVEAIISAGRVVTEAPAGSKVDLVLDKTPFYAEAGGQVGDRGLLTAPGVRVEVEDCTPLAGDLILHRGQIKEGVIKTGMPVKAQVNTSLRLATARNHTATHLLHWALRHVLGEHVQQAGSLVNGEGLRFDFSHFTALGEGELRKVERLINERILKNSPVQVTVTSAVEARQMGAIALFGEKYKDQVRVVGIGDYSLELCGGTHVPATGSIGLFKILSEGSIGAGLRRLEAVTGMGALKYVNTLEDSLAQAAAGLKTTPGELPQRIASLVAESKKKDAELEALGHQLVRLQVEELLNGIRDLGSVKLLAEEVKAKGMAELRTMVDILREKLPAGIILLGAPQHDRIDFVCSVSPDLVQEGFHAGKIIKEVARVAGGGGGGRPDMAQAGGRKIGHLREALTRGIELIQGQLGN